MKRLAQEREERSLDSMTYSSRRVAGIGNSGFLMQKFGAGVTKNCRGTNEFVRRVWVDRTPSPEIQRLATTAIGPNATKAGLVGPAFLLWNWFVRSFLIAKPETQSLSGSRDFQRRRLRIFSHPALRPRRVTVPPELHDHCQVLQLVLKNG